MVEITPIIPSPTVIGVKKVRLNEGKKNRDQQSRPEKDKPEKPESDDLPTQHIDERV
ncbi:MAG: hypothetical protein ACXV7J_10955 [Methylomonas sp.]